MGVWDSRRTAFSHSSSLDSVAKLGGIASNTHSSSLKSAWHRLLLGYNIDSYLHEGWMELGGLHYVSHGFSIVACVSPDVHSFEREAQ